jgi:hypothetical protein
MSHSCRPYLYSTPDRLSLFSTIFAGKLEMSAIAKVPSSGLGKLEVDAIDGTRVCLEKVNIWAQGGRAEITVGSSRPQ